MKKLLAVLFVFAGLCFSQGIPSITPGIVSLTVDKAVDETKLLPPITLSVNAAGHFAYTIILPQDIEPHVKVLPKNGFLFPNGSDVLTVEVNLKNLTPGTYYFPIVAKGLPEGVNITGYSVSTHVTLNVINSLNPNDQPNQADRMVPHIAVGGNWSTTVRLYNPSERMVKQWVQLFSQTGTPMIMKVNELNIKEFPIELKPKTVKELVFSGDGELQVGTAVFKMVSGVTPGINVIYNQKKPVRETAVKIDEGSEIAMIKFDNKGRKSTGLVIGNFGKDVQDVEIEVYDVDGMKKEVKFVRVPSMGSVVFASDEKFLSLKDTEGTLIIRGIGKWLMVYAIQFDLDNETFSTEQSVQ